MQLSIEKISFKDFNVTPPPPPVPKKHSPSMKNLVVAGNGPSLKSIDYSLLPKDFDVFRANQFYAETEYYLGKKVKGAFFNLHFIKPQTYTFYQLKEQGEYDIEQIYCSYPFPLANSFNPNVLDLFPDVKLYHSYLVQFPKLYFLNCYYERYFACHFTSGISMIITGIALGYKKIYLTGIDLYEGKEKYAFNHSSNILKLLPKIDKVEHKDSAHNKQIELKALELCNQYITEMGGAIYSISPDSAMSKMFPTPPPIQKSCPPTIKTSKNADAILDIILQKQNTKIFSLLSWILWPLRFLLRLILLPLIPWLKRSYFKLLKFIQ